MSKVTEASSKVAAQARSGAILTIDIDAVRANYRLLRERVQPAACSAVVKSDAYGLGAAQVAAALHEEGCRHFFVAHLEEGISLRPHVAPDAAIFVLHGPPVGTEGEFTRHGLIPVLNSEPQVAGWRAHAAALDRELDAIVQVDTGMSRMGMSPQEIDGWLADAHFLDGIKVLYIMSHLACADERYHPANAQQLARFLEIRARLPQYAASLANSSGVFLSPDYHFDLVRPGAALYGITPQAGEPNPLRSVVRLQGKVIQTRSINAGDHVGYSCRYTATGPCVVATVSVGYADGWLRSMSNQGVAVIDGVRVPQVGAISMDSITLDVSNIDAGRVAPGQLVDLICPEHPVDAVAAMAHTIGYEVLTNLGGRYFRVYTGLAQGAT